MGAENSTSKKGHPMNTGKGPNSISPSVNSSLAVSNRHVDNSLHQVNSNNAPPSVSSPSLDTGAVATKAVAVESSMPIPMSPTIPCFVDRNSTVYATPSMRDEFTMTSRKQSNSVNLGSPSLPRSMRYSKVNSDFLFSAPPPMQPSTPRRVGGPLPPVSTAIPFPIYNSAPNFEDFSCGSQVLRSYRKHSISLMKDFRQAAQPGSLTHSVSGFNTGTLAVGSLPVGSAAEALSSSHLSGFTGATSIPRNSSESAPIHARYLEITGCPLGLENYGNTCYCNSVVQLLYHCAPLRLRLLELHKIYSGKKGGAGFEENTLLYHLCNLFAVMHKSNNPQKQTKRLEVIAPRELLLCVRQKHAIFNDNTQQDAHEFAMLVLNDIMETEQLMMADPKNQALFAQEGKKKKSRLTFWRSGRQSGKDKDKFAACASATATATADSSDYASLEGDVRHTSSTTSKSRPHDVTPPPTSNTRTMTPLQSILQGQYGSFTACLECGTISAREEVFIDLSLETTQGSSLLNCINHFSDEEYFYGDNKLRCKHCKGPVRAAKTIHIQQLPQYALLVHLKRFQYDAQKGHFTKKTDHVALPMHMDLEEYLTEPSELDISNDAATDNTRMHTEEAAASGGSSLDSPREAFKHATEAIRQKLRGIARHKARFTLTGFVVHLGEGPSQGHYFTCVRYGPQLWRCFDDDVVSDMTEREIQQHFGVPINLPGVVTSTAYILVYERVE